MRVRHGWSGEVATNRWAKDDVELDEEDLRRLLNAAGLGTDVSVSVAYELLEIEAERLLIAKLMRRYGHLGAPRLVELGREKATVLARLSRTVAPPAAPS